MERRKGRIGALRESAGGDEEREGGKRWEHGELREGDKQEGSRGFELTCIVGSFHFRQRIDSKMRVKLRVEHRM